MLFDVEVATPPQMTEDLTLHAGVRGAIRVVGFRFADFAVRWTPRHGWDEPVACYEVKFVGERTARNTQQDALAAVANACQRAGLWAENDGRAVQVYRCRQDAAL